MTPPMEPQARRVALPSGVELHTLDWRPAIPSDQCFVLTHGLASNARLWDGVARRLAARHHRVVTVDQRGHGQSSKPDDGYDMPTVADDLALLVEALDLPGAPIVAGQSWGGNVVVELAHRHPGIARQIVAVDGGFIRLRDRFPDWGDAAVALAPPRLLGTPVADIERWLSTMAADWPEEGRAGTLANFEVRADGTIAPWLSFERHLTVLRGLWEHDPFDRFATLPVPALILAADDGDAARSADKRAAVAEAVRLLPTGRAVWFSPAHHDVHAQQPDAVAAVLHDAATDPTFYDTVTPEAHP